MMFLGRTDELEWLNGRYTSDKPEFIVLYGRRRIGKSSLLREFTHGKPHLFYTAVQTTDTVQLTRMSAVVNAGLGSEPYGRTFPDWENLFRFISDHVPEKEKLIIVFDEFPYAVQGNTSLPSVLQLLWDQFFSQRNVLFILCGSSMSFMEKEILSEKNPLYGRTTGILKLEELSFEASRPFFGTGSISEHLQAYSVFSGVPYYLSLYDARFGFQENLKRQLLQNGSVLFHEAEFLLRQELREVGMYNAVIEAVASGDTRMNDISGKTGIDRHKLSYYLDGLMDLGIVRREYPVTMKTKEMAKSRSGLYKLDNGYFRFFYAYVHPYMSELLEGASDTILSEIVLPALPTFVSQEFERLAIRDIRNLGLKKKLPFIPIRIGRWWERSTEIDLLAYDLHGNRLFGECKWRNERTGVSVLKQLQSKSMAVHPDTVSSAARDYFVLFSKTGFTDELLAMATPSEPLFLIDYSGETQQYIGFP